MNDIGLESALWLRFGSNFPTWFRELVESQTGLKSDEALSIAYQLWFTSRFSGVRVWSALNLDQNVYKGRKQSFLRVKRAFERFKGLGLLQVRLGEFDGKVTRIAPSNVWQGWQGLERFSVHRIEFGQEIPRDELLRWRLAGKEERVFRFITSKRTPYSQMRTAVASINKARKGTVYAIGKWSWTADWTLFADDEARVGVIKSFLAQGNNKQLQHYYVECCRSFVALDNGVPLSKLTAQEQVAGGGRLVCDFHSMPSSLRRSLTINGEQAVELDVATCQPRIAYALAGLDAPTDVYASICPGNRERAKGFMMWLCGTSSNKLNLWSYNESEAGKVERFTKEDWTRAVTVLKPVWHQFGNGGFWLQGHRLESDWLVQVLVRLGDELGYGPLSVHDCVVVKDKDKDRAKEVMKEEWRKVIGNECMVKE